MSQCPDHQAPHQRRVTKPDFSLRGVDIDVDQTGVHFQKQGQDWVAILGPNILIGGAGRTL